MKNRSCYICGRWEYSEEREPIALTESGQIVTWPPGAKKPKMVGRMLCDDCLRDEFFVKYDVKVKNAKKRRV